MVKSHFYPFLTVLPVLPSNLFVPAVLWTVIFLFCPPNPRNSVFLALVAASLTMAHSLLIFCFISLSLSRSLCPSFSTFSVFGFFISKLYFCFLLLCPTLSSHFWLYVFDVLCVFVCSLFVLLGFLFFFFWILGFSIFFFFLISYCCFFSFLLPWCFIILEYVHLMLMGFFFFFFFFFFGFSVFHIFFFFPIFYFSPHLPFLS